METASHPPFQDHELSISWHVPEREYTEPTDRLTGEKIEIGQGRSNLDPITAIEHGATGGMGRTTILVAESTCQPPEKEIFTPGNVSRGEEPEYRGEPIDSRQMRGESAERDSGLQRRGESEWALPKPLEPHRPPGESTTGREVPSLPN